MSAGSLPLRRVLDEAIAETGGSLKDFTVLAAQNDVPAHELGATTSVMTFFRSMGGAIGVSALGAVMANRITSLFVERFGPAAGGSGSTQVPDLKSLPPAVLAQVQEVYGIATSDLFLIGAPIGGSFRSLSNGWLRGPSPMGVTHFVSPRLRSIAVTRPYGGLSSCRPSSVGGNCVPPRM